MRGSRGSRCARGFTLIELVVTMIIAGILAALVFPNFNQPDIDATWFHQQVKAAVRYAQREAVAQRRFVFVRVPSATQLQLCYDAACATPLTQMARTTAFVLNAPAGITLSSSVTPFSFNGLGQPNPIAGVTITVAGKNITVTAETGYVK